LISHLARSRPQRLAKKNLRRPRRSQPPPAHRCRSSTEKYFRSRPVYSLPARFVLLPSSRKRGDRKNDVRCGYSRLMCCLILIRVPRFLASFIKKQASEGNTSSDSEHLSISGMEH